MTLDGRLFPSIRNNTVLNGERYCFRGDFRETEFTGVISAPTVSGCSSTSRRPGSPLR